MAPKKKKTKKSEELIEDLEIIDDNTETVDSESDEDEEEQEVALVTEVDSIELPASWGQTAVNISEIRKARSMISTKHGMFMNVPMVCKGSDCPLHETCTIPVVDRPVGQRCPIEIGSIIELYDRYITEHNVGPEDYFDQSQVKDLVDTEIKLLRANGYLAITADFIEQVVAGIDDKGNAHYRPELHKATDYEKDLLARKRQILADLMATRKSRKDDKKISDPSSFAAGLMQRAMKAMQMQQSNVVDAEYTTSEEKDNPKPESHEDGEK